MGFESQKCRSGFARWFWPKAFREVVAKLLTRVSVIGRFGWTGNPHPDFPQGRSVVESLCCFLCGPLPACGCCIRLAWSLDWLSTLERAEKTDRESQVKGERKWPRRLEHVQTGDSQRVCISHGVGAGWSSIA